MTPFPHPAHRTGHADLPHPALGQDFTPLLSRATPPAVSEHSSELIGCPISGFTLRAIPPRCHSGATPSRCPLAAPFNACGLVKIIDVVRNLSASCRWRSCALEVRPNSRLRRPWCPSTEECTGRHLSAVLRRASPLSWSGRSRTRSLPHLRAQLFGNCARNGGGAHGA